MGRGFARAAGLAGAVGLRLGDGLLGHGLLRRGLHDRLLGGGGGSHTRLGDRVLACIAVAGRIALALGRLAITLAHLCSPDSLKSTPGSGRLHVRPPDRGAAREAAKPTTAGPSRPLPASRAGAQWAQLASWMCQWFRRRFSRWARPTSVPPTVMTMAGRTTASCRGAYSTPAHRAARPNRSMPSARKARWRR